MVVSPKSLPLGYRWMDALVHEYIHLIVNEITHTQAELWLQEGTARYLETSYRVQPPFFLTPHQKTKLIEAQEEDRLISFDRMSPSLVYLDSQEEVSLAFAEVSYSISYLMAKKGNKKFTSFLKNLNKMSFSKAFEKIYKMSPHQFEKTWQNHLKSEKWEKRK